MFCCLLCTKSIYQSINNNRDPIECITLEKYKSQVETFCWTHGTYINERLLHETNEIGKHMVNYGIGGDREGDKYIYQYYYQWVVPILLLEALIFYFPKLLWRTWENGRMQTICSKISKVIHESKCLFVTKQLLISDCPYINNDWDSKHKVRILKFIRNVTKKCHRAYALKYFFCEALSGFALVCLIKVVLFQIC